MRCLIPVVLLCLAACAPHHPGAPSPAAGSPLAEARPAGQPLPAAAQPALTADFESKGWTAVVSNAGPEGLYVVVAWERGVPGGWEEYARSGQVIGPGESARLSAPCGWPGAIRVGILGQPQLQHVWWSTSSTCVAGATTN